MRTRLDTELARRGLAASRERAQRLILAGCVRVNSRPAGKPDLKVDENSHIEVVAVHNRYASRGAYKLAAALAPTRCGCGWVLSPTTWATCGGGWRCPRRSGSGR
jgi:predicted rRNA methylase YqxC with S4 and FtsJ domains